MAHSVFISYSHKDQAIAEAICSCLESDGIICWYASRNIMPGEDWASAIIQALRSSKIMILIFSDFSNKSPQVLREVSNAVDAGITLIPFRLTQAEPEIGMKYYLTTVHWLNAVEAPLDQKIHELNKLIHTVLGVQEPPVFHHPDEKYSIAPTPSKPFTNKRKCLLILLIIVLVVFVLFISIYIMKKDSANPHSDISATDTSQVFVTDEFSTSNYIENIPTTIFQEPISDEDPVSTSIVSSAFKMRYGLNDEVLEQIAGVTIFGDHFEYWKSNSSSLDPDLLAVFSEEDHVWYWRKGAQRIEFTVWDDLSILTAMTNLETLNLIMVDLPQMPLLSHLQHLKNIYIEDCKIDNLEWIKGSQIQSFSYHGSHITDFSVLESCPNLTKCDISPYFMFASPETIPIITEQVKSSLTFAMIAGDILFNGEYYSIYRDSISAEQTAEILNTETGDIIQIRPGTIKDFNILDGFENISKLCLFSQPIDSLETLKSKLYLSSLTLLNCNELKSLDTLSNFQSLRYLDASYCKHLKSIHGIAALSGLRELVLCGLPVTDYSSLSALQNLTSLKIMDVPISLWANSAKSLTLSELALGGYETDQIDLIKVLVGHPEITSLQILYAGDYLTDLSFLINMPNLKKVGITEDMAHLMKSLEGKEYHFDLEFIY